MQAHAQQFCAFAAGLSSHGLLSWNPRRQRLSMAQDFRSAKAGNFASTADLS